MLITGRNKGKYMELGKSINLDGKAAYKPEDTYAHSIAHAFGASCGFDHEGKVVSPDSPHSGPHSPSMAPPMREGDR
jgi:hypothetical protein